MAPEPVIVVTYQVIIEEKMVAGLCGFSLSRLCRNQPEAYICSDGPKCCDTLKSLQRIVFSLFGSVSEDGSVPKAPEPLTADLSAHYIFMSISLSRLPSITCLSCVALRTSLSRCRKSIIFLVTIKEADTRFSVGLSREGL